MTARKFMAVYTVMHSQYQLRLQKTLVPHKMNEDSIFHSEFVGLSTIINPSCPHNEKQLMAGISGIKIKI